MGAVIIGLGIAIALVGAAFGFNGFAVYQSTFGNALIVVGGFAFVGGLVLMALGFVLRALVRIELRLEGAVHFEPEEGDYVGAVEAIADEAERETRAEAEAEPVSRPVSRSAPRAAAPEPVAALGAEPEADPDEDWVPESRAAPRAADPASRPAEPVRAPEPPRSEPARDERLIPDFPAREPVPPPRVEAPRPEPVRPEPVRSEPPRSEPRMPDFLRAPERSPEPARAAPALGADLPLVEPSRVRPAPPPFSRPLRAEVPGRAEAPRPDSARVEPVRAEAPLPEPDAAPAQEPEARPSLRPELPSWFRRRDPVAAPVTEPPAAPDAAPASVAVAEPVPAESRAESRGEAAPVAAEPSAEPAVRRSSDLPGDPFAGTFGGGGAATSSPGRGEPPAPEPAEPAGQDEDLSAVFAPRAARAEPVDPFAAPAAPEPADSDRPDPAEPAAPEPEEAKEEESGPVVLKSGIIGGMAYSLYTDGSIEAELPDGVIRFASIQDLRDHVTGAARTE